MASCVRAFDAATTGGSGIGSGSSSRHHPFAPSDRWMVLAGADVTFDRPVGALGCFVVAPNPGQPQPGRTVVIPMECERFRLPPRLRAVAHALIAEHSYFWVGVERTTRPGGGTVATGEHMFVEYFVPAEQRNELPIVFVHGGGGQGVAFLGLGDGHAGWLHHALKAGYTVYLVDRPGFGRNPPIAELIAPESEATPYEALMPFFKVGAASGRWKGTAEPGDPGLDAFMAQQRPMRFDTVAYAHALTRRRGAELLDRIGPAILITHSAGGPFGWLVADAQPSLVRALVAVEGLGPTTLGVPLTYDPPVKSNDELALEPLPDEPGIDWGVLAGLPRVIQAEPVRRLVNLAQVPIAVVSSDDPRFGVLNRDTIAYLEQGGCEVTHLRLADLGIAGNSHLMSLEENNGEVLGVMLDWVAGAVA
jgi:pimeloyl-ACP methyl ester carboxylesterase